LSAHFPQFPAFAATLHSRHGFFGLPQTSISTRRSDGEAGNRGDDDPGRRLAESDGSTETITTASSSAATETAKVHAAGVPETSDSSGSDNELTSRSDEDDPLRVPDAADPIGRTEP